MSLTAKITLGTAIGISAAIIGYVHYKQSEDRLKLHEGVLRDVEQQQRRKHENTYALQQQIDMTKQLKSMQTKSEEKSQDSSNSSSNKTPNLDSVALQPPP